MVLNMADFVNSCKSLQTLWNACKTVLKWFVTACANVCVDFGLIRSVLKLADFEQKAWAIAHGFEHGRFCQLPQIAPNSLKHLQNRSKMICKLWGSAILRMVLNCLSWNRSKLSERQNRSKMNCLCRFRVNSKIGRFWAKGLGYMVLNMADFVNSCKSLQTLCKTVLKWFVTACDCLCRFRVNS